jgi:hypothetical protein
VRISRGRPRLVFVIVSVLVAVAALAATFATRSEGGKAEALREQLEALHGHLKTTDPDAQTAFTAKNHGLGSPDSYFEQQLQNLAYPSNTLKASTLASERSTAKTVNGRSVLKNATWQQSGPQTATQPAVLNFFDNQASDFQVSGRVTAIAVDPSCTTSSCRVWVAAAGGGVWRTDNGLASTPSWTFTSGSFGTNAIGTLTYDAATHTLYAGTGEPNASGDSEAGVGIYASTDGGNTWSLLPGSSAAMAARSISSIVVDPNHPGTLYVGTTRGVRGVSAVAGGAVSLAPDAAPWGLWKSTDGGQHFTFVWDGHGSVRGVNHAEFDPTHNTIYAAAFGEGIWRSTDGGSTWEQVFATQDPTNTSARSEFALNWVDGHTRIYVGDGGSEIGTDAFGLPTSNTGVYRADSIDTKSASELTNGTTDAGYESLTSSDPTDPKWGTYDYCEGQCWYDNYVVSPAGHPDDVYVGGSFDYNLYSFAENGKAVLLSTDAGEHWSDQTRDNGDPTVGIHPDQHALAVDPANPLIFFEGSDGGMVHSSGELTDGTANCPVISPTKASHVFEVACDNLLANVPTRISTMNAGLSTLQFGGIATRGSTVFGGTQDNGTWLGTAGNPAWTQTIYGDGGVPAFDATNTSFLLNEFYDWYTDGNFQNGNPTKWVILSGPFFNPDGSPKEGSEFYKPQIGDPVVSGTFFVGLQSVWRTQDFGGNQADLEKNCPEFTTSGAKQGCGDFVQLGSPSDLGSTTYGSDRSGGFVAALARASSDHSTLWAATSTGRVFVSQNADDPTASAVTFTRIDNTSTAAPNRFVSGIVVDPSNPDRAWISYTGYNENTPSTPGHVFQVEFDATTGKATFTALDGNGAQAIGDLPVTALARNPSTGDLYVGTDFGVLANTANGAGKINGPWKPLANGLPQVEISDLKFDQSTSTLYAGTHGRAIWQVSLGGK